jgi:transposase
MTQEQLFSAALMVQEPWFVSEVSFDAAKGRLDVEIDFRKGAVFRYESKDEQIAGDFKAYDVALKTWRHLNFFQYECLLHAKVPRVDIGNGKVRLVSPPWEGKVPGFTLLMEALILELARQMPVHRVGIALRVSDGRIWRLLHRYVEIGVENQKLDGLTQFGVDETAVLRGQTYISMIVDLVQRKTVFIADGKGSNVLETFAQELVRRGGVVDNITAVSQDMSPAFQAGVEKNFPKAKIVFDRFHVMKMICEALDSVRRSEAGANPVLKLSRFALLKNEANLTVKQRFKLEEIKMKDLELKTARAWRMKVRFQELYQLPGLTAFEAGLKQWLDWVRRSRIVAMIEVGRTIRRHLEGILNWMTFKVSNGILEGLNSKFQAAKAKARGYRTLKTIKTVIYLLSGKLDFTPLNRFLPT